MKRFQLRQFSILILAISIGAAAFAQDAVKAKAAKKQQPANKALEPIADEAGLPRVLLIGDSISIGYTLPVRERLRGKANVHRIPTNGGPTINGVAQIDKWLGTSKWDVIHFNWGLHDLKQIDGKQQVEPADYEANLKAMVARLKQTNATLIWCSTTPVPSGPLNPPRRVEDVVEYNAIASKVMTAEGVLTDDLYGYAEPIQAEIQLPNNVHFSEAGSAKLADKVAMEIEKALASPRKK